MNYNLSFNFIGTQINNFNYYLNPRVGYYGTKTVLGAITMPFNTFSEAMFRKDTCC